MILADKTVTGFAIDNRKVAPGNVFGAFVGAAVNGEDFIPAAIKAGAVAVVARPEARVEGALHIADANPRRAFARLAAQFYQPVPATIAAVTGTNGKTSCVEMTRQLWRMGGERAASIGTLGVTTPDETVSTGLTTPDIVTFLANMAGLAAEGVSHVAYEASSHGLDQYRNEGLRVAAGAFTNLSRDHLDYHETMEGYFAAKMRLFDEVVMDGGAAVIWADDEWSGRAMAHARARGLRLLTVGEAGEGVRLVKRTPGQLGQVLEIELDGAPARFTLPLIGAYQAANALVSAGLALATGMAPARVLDGLARLQPVRGRLDRAALSRAGAPVDRGVWRGRRPRCRQAARNGRCGGARRGCGYRHRRQPARRGRCDHSRRRDGGRRWGLARGGWQERGHCRGGRLGGGAGYRADRRQGARAGADYRARGRDPRAALR